VQDLVEGLERKVAERTKALEIASKHKSEFLANMSHEIRTPMNAILGMADVLADSPLTVEQHEYVEVFRRAGDALLSLLNDILDLSKVEAGRMELEHSTFSVRSALEYGISMVRERASAHGIEVGLDVDQGVETLDSDELRFKQVLLNLLSNAVKFTPDGGHVRVVATRDGGEVAVTVTDDGAGIPPEDRERIFESFQQGRRGAQSEEGTGLGLTLCRRIVALLGGRMWLETELGKGSTFGFTVPLIGAAPAAELAPRMDADLPLVVVVDDDRASLDLITAYLDGLGVRIALARDGVEGLELIRTLNPAAVVLDIRLPALDGWEVLARLRADIATREVPVVIVSILDEKHRGLALGAVDYLVKPVARDDLVGALRRVGAVSPRAVA
jgi:CheY-like chemotaxis protein